MGSDDSISHDTQLCLLPNVLLFPSAGATCEAWALGQPWEPESTVSLDLCFLNNIEYVQDVMANISSCLQMQIQHKGQCLQYVYFVLIIRSFPEKFGCLLLLVSLSGLLSFENERQTTMKTEASVSATLFYTVGLVILGFSQTPALSLLICIKQSCFSFCKQILQCQTKAMIKISGSNNHFKRPYPLNINTLFERNTIYFQGTLSFEYCLFSTH